MKKIVTILIGVLLSTSMVRAEYYLSFTAAPVLCADGQCVEGDENNVVGKVGFMQDDQSTITWYSKKYTHTYKINAQQPRKLNIYASGNDYNYFVGWAESYTSSGGYTLKGYYRENQSANLFGYTLGLPEVDWSADKSEIYVYGVGLIVDLGWLGKLGDTGDPHLTRYAIFKPRAAYYDYAEAEVMVIDGTGKPLKDAMENLEYNGCTVHVSNCGEANGNVVGGLKVYGEGESRIKSFAATSGTYGGYTYTANAQQGYTFKGWYRADAIDQSLRDNGVADLSESNREASTSSYTMPADRYTTTKTYKQVEANNHCEKVPKLYAIFQPSFSLSRYVAANDEFAAMTAKVENGIYTYADPAVSPTAESLYQVDHAYGADLKLSCTDDFVATFDTIQGRTVIRVNPSSTKETLSGVIAFYTDTDGTKKTIATLTLTASNTPVFVTLLPADGYTGTYTYRQNTTGATEFPVTTSAVTKQLITATDYKFNFKPTPVDASKTKFDHWIITKKDGSEEKSTTANLYKEFEGGETIQPVFIPAHRTTFIILSQPDVHYYDLQKALDAAAKMDNPQDQVVTVYAPTSTTERLPYKEGGYTIWNGVTFLIPGDAKYSNLMKDATSDDFTRDENLNSTSCYCKLSVDDNTNITVENGNISIFSGLKAFQYDNGGRMGYGQLDLGKNCKITVEKDAGGLYAFGFITGDKSSEVIMESGTTIYEVFNFKDCHSSTTLYKLHENEYDVFPIGQYYIQSVEVPLTLKYGAIEKVSTVIYATMYYPMNFQFIGNTKEALFVLGEGTSVTKSYDPNTDRLKLEFVGEGKESILETGCIKTNLLGRALNSDEYVLPIQNNMDIEVKNITININSDIALMPSAKLFVHKDAKVDIKEGVNMFVYDEGAKKVLDCNCTGGYWGPLNNMVLPLKYKNNDPRPGTIDYRNTLSDASIVLDGVMDVHGALYTVKGNFTDANDEEGGANITSNGGGKINVYNIGDKKHTYQYHINTSISPTEKCKNSSGFYPLQLTSPNLKLHNNTSLGADSAYTHVKMPKVSRDISSNPLVYTYYQNDGMWREDSVKLPISGIKLYDSIDNEINQFYVTMPTPDTIYGYILASLETIAGVSYDKDASDFSIELSPGYIKFDANNAREVIGGNKLKIPVIYIVQNEHGTTSQTITITHSTAESTYSFLAPVKAQENYTPVFSVPASVDMYACVADTLEVALPIQCSDDNVASLIKSVNSGDTKWTAIFKNADNSTNSDFQFVLGTESDKELSGAQIIYTPTNDTRRTVTLTLTANYKANNNVVTSSRTVTINAYPAMVANTMEFNEVGTITSGRVFDLLRSVNSKGALKLLDAQGDEITLPFSNDVLTIALNDKGDNFIVTAKNPGAVNVRVKQEANGAYAEKIIEKTIIVNSTPSPLGTGICAENESKFNLLTSALDKVVYSQGAILFNGTSSWTAQYEGVAGNISFTPTGGDGYWAVEESRGDGEEWTPTSVYWTKLPSNNPIVVNLLPTSRRVKISYNDPNGQGTLTYVCVNPLTINVDKTKIYVPIITGQTSTEMVFTHGTPNLTFELSGDNNGYWTKKEAKNKKEGSTDYNMGGVLNVYYETKVTLTADSNVVESANSVTLTAKPNKDSATPTVSVNVATYNYPKLLPIKTKEWTATEGDNGYQKSEYYYHYMVESSFVKWDEANQDLIFLNKGDAAEASRHVVFGFKGMPDVVEFKSATTDWTIEQYTDDNGWTVASAERTVSTTNDLHTISQPITGNPKYIRITYSGTIVDEVVLKNLVIQGFPSAEAKKSEDIDSDLVTEIVLTSTTSQTFYIHVKNLASLQLAMQNSSGFEFTTSTDQQISFDDGLALLEVNTIEEAKVIPVKVKWKAEHIADEGYLLFQDPNDQTKDLHSIHIVGSKGVVTSKDVNTGIYTGVPKGYVLDGSGAPGSGLFEPYQHHEVKLTNTFAGDKALFDYVIIYGETTIDGSNPLKDEKGNIIITTPGTPALEEKGSGSNALTPYYILKKNSAGDRYYFLQMVENANSPTKAIRVLEHDEGQTSLSCYITGFCPYATTGYTFEDEGVWYFRGPAGTRVDIYLEDCHIYSRNKSEFGAKYGKNHEHISWFNEQVVQGSGAVLVFENKIDDIQNYPTCRGAEEGCQVDTTFDVAIHTIGHNVLKSNYGSYLNVLGMSGKLLAAQVSAPVQVRLGDVTHVNVAKTILDFDDKWPTAISENQNGGFDTTFVRTNGFLSLQKQQNYAPSIDLGNPHTVVNFRGGRVQLQNAAIKSPNYKTTLAISWRGGKMGNIDDFLFAYGLGTDSVSGTVNFYDGTTTVIPMKVDGVYQDFYLMDEDNPNYTSCLRTPTNTFIYGGSHCMLRACNYVTSKGGAPKDGPGGNFLGLYKYPYASWTETKDGQEITHKGGWTTNGEKGLVSIPEDNLPNANYGDESITPNTNGTDTIPNDDYLNLWVTKGYDDNVNIEEDKELHYWYACMTKIEGGGLGVNAKVGGDIEIKDDDEIRNLLYCQLDDYIYDVISATDPEKPKNDNGDPNYTYEAPAKDPSGQMDEPYYRIGLTNVSDQKQHKIIRKSDYEVTNKLYYITTAKADTWMNFTMPFDVARIWIVEAFDESLIKINFEEYKEADKDKDKEAEGYLSPMEQIKMFQARHNADFAAFFAMAMAIGTYGKDFGEILNDYINWAIIEDNEDLDDIEVYNKRGLYELEHYDGSNFTSAHYYLYKNMGNWQLTEDYEVSTARWEVAPSVTDNGGILMNKGETYSMLFPYCTGCDVLLEQDSITGQWDIVIGEDSLPKIVERDYWDYWSGKLLIFESTAAPKRQPHVISGSNYIAKSKVGGTPWIFDDVLASSDSAVLTGNATFSMMSVEDYDMRDAIFTYDDTPYVETFLPAQWDAVTEKPIYETLVPTESFLVVDYPEPIKLITRNGRVVTDDRDDQGNGNQGTTTGGHMPTVGGGHDMLITGTADGINVAVASPQMVYVVTTTGAVIYSGYVESDINIPLPISGIYLIKGENEVQKIFY